MGDGNSYEAINSAGALFVAPSMQLLGISAPGIGRPVIVAKQNRRAMVWM
jgi:hypothetical protein